MSQERGQGFELKNFLDAARHGGTVDSEGSFTVAADKALSKLAKFALPHEYDWVLKIVQAAHCFESERLEVRQTRVATTFFWCPAAHLFVSDNEVISALKTGALDRSGPVDKLCMALRSLVDQVGLSFVLAIFRDGEQGQPIYAGDDIGSLSAEDRLKWSNLKSPGFRLTVSHFRGTESFTGRYLPTFNFVARRDLKISEILVNQGAYGSSAVYLDGRLLSSVVRNPSTRTRELAVGTVGKAANSEDRQTEWRFFNPKSSRSRLRLPRPHRGRDAAVLYLSTLDNYFPPFVYADPRTHIEHQPPMFHRFVWTLNGVPAASGRLRAATLATTFCLVVNGDHLRSDLTGLSVSLEQEELMRARSDLLLLTLRLEQLTERLTGYLQEDTRSNDLLPESGHGDEAVPSELSAAGFSIYSESLRLDFSGLKRSALRLREWMDRSSLMGDGERALEAWLQFVGKDLTRLRRDIEEQSELSF